MIPKVGQLLRWYDNAVLLSDTPHHDIGIVKEVQIGLKARTSLATMSTNML